MAGFVPVLAATAADLAAEVRAAGLDHEQCYRIRDLSLTKEDLRFYFTDGYLVFGKPVSGRRHSAVFLGDVEAGDAEVLVFPPTRSERMSLARRTKSPNLNEHFRLAVMIFSDDTYEVLREQIESGGRPQKTPEQGILAANRLDSVIRNLTSSFEVRLMEDVLGETPPAEGFFFASLRGEKLGNFDVLYDPRSYNQIVIGAVTERGGDSYYDIWTSFEARSFRNRTRQAPDVYHRLENYRIDAWLASDLTLKVATKAVLKSSRSGLRVLEFAMSPRMRIASVSIDGRPAEFYQRESLRESLLREGDGVFLVLAPEALEAGREYEIEFTAEGAIIQSAGNNVYFVGARTSWYPNIPGTFTIYEVTFRYPAELSLALPGEELESGADGGQKLTRRRISTPVRFLGFNLGDYDRVLVTRGPYRIEVLANKQAEAALRAAAQGSYSLIPRAVYDPATRRTVIVQTPVLVVPPPPVPTLQLRQIASEVAAAFEFMVDWFGPPPLSTLIVSPIPGTFGQGFPGLVYLSTYSYIRPEQRPTALKGDYPETFFSDILHAHEVAHQWWGNAVFTNSPQDSWLMEALANYSALLYLEKRRGARALEQVLAEYRQRLLRRVADEADGTVESMGPIVWGPRLRFLPAAGAWELITYEKGSWILHMLRRKMGDQRFAAFLGELAREFNRRPITTEEFRLAAARHLPPSSPDPKLETFFQSYVYSTGVPTLQLQSSVKGKSPVWTVTGKVTQSGVDEDFAVWVPVEVQFRSGPPLVQWVRTDLEPAEFKITVKQVPVRVILDPSGSLLAVKK